MMSRSTYFRVKIMMTLLAFIWAMNIEAKSPDKQEVISFGIVPQQSASQLAKTWGPIMRYLEAETGLRIIFRTAPDIPTFEQRLYEGEYDIAYMNPFHFTVFNRQPGYRALAKAKDKKIHGIIVVRKDSDIKTLNDLQGKEMAFPAPAAFAATVLPLANFKVQGIGIKTNYVLSHDSVYRTVAKGIFAAGGGVMRTFKSVDPKVSQELRVLWTTPGYTPHAIAFHPRVNSKQLAAIKQAVVEMHLSEQGKYLLKRVSIKEFEVAQDKDWDDVRALKIDLTTGKKGKLK